MKFCTYILNNTLMVVRLKGLIKGEGGRGDCHPLLGTILSFAFLRGGGTFSVFFSTSWERFGMFS